MLVDGDLTFEIVLFEAKLPHLSETHYVHDREPFHDKYLALYWSVNVDLVLLQVICTGCIVFINLIDCCVVVWS